MLARHVSDLTGPSSGAFFLPHTKSANASCTKRSWRWTGEFRNMSSWHMWWINPVIRKLCVSCWTAYKLQDDTRSVQYQNEWENVAKEWEVVLDWSLRHQSTFCTSLCSASKCGLCIDLVWLVRRPEVCRRTHSPVVLLSGLLLGKRWSGTMDLPCANERWYYLLDSSVQWCGLTVLFVPFRKYDEGRLWLSVCLHVSVSEGA